MDGIDFGGSPISETDDDDYIHDHVPGNVVEYRGIWDHEDIPLEHEIVDQSGLPPGYHFASGLSREELRSRYQFRGNGIVVDSVGTADAYVHFDPEAERLSERYCAVLADRTQRPTLSESDDEEEAAFPTRPETWPNGRPMWATAPGGGIQLRMPPIPDRNRVFASNADSPEEVPDVPSVAQLTALWEKQFPGTARVENGVQPDHVMRYVDDDPPLRRERPPFVDSNDEESNSDPGMSESPTQYYADEVLTHVDDDRSSSHVTS